MPLSTAERLAGELGLTAPDFGLEEGAYQSRIGIWEELAGEREGISVPQKAAHVQYLALRAAITALMRRADKFRAEGDITTERNILGRVAILQGWFAEAKAGAGLTEPSPVASRASANPAPEFGTWGIYDP